MGKIRIKTIGDEEAEKKDIKKVQARLAAKKAREEAEAKRAGVDETTGSEENKIKVTDTVNDDTEVQKKEVIVTETVKQKTDYKKSTSKKHKSSSYQKVAQLIDKNKKYKLSEALPLLEKMKRASFDETVELHINTIEKGISGSLVLPHGSGKTVRVTIANASVDPKNVEDLIKKIESGKIDFDVLVATPDTMPKLAKVARVLGPRGLMPNPKNGTVTTKPEEIAKKFEGGHSNFKTESKFPIIHLAVGKISFGDKKLTDNITTAVKTIKSKNIRSMTLKSTLSPGMKLDFANLNN